MHMSEPTSCKATVNLVEVNDQVSLYMLWAPQKNRKVQTHSRRRQQYHGRMLRTYPPLVVCVGGVEVEPNVSDDTAPVACGVAALPAGAGAAV